MNSGSSTSIRIGEWDRIRLEQVFTNLLTNAIRYGKGRPVTITLAGESNFVRGDVKDQGIGIAEDAKTIIFDRFERAISASEVSGLGLGLFIAQQIVEAHQGKIWVESELGKGATFTVELPKRRLNQKPVEAVEVL
jgi:signal transduction histidine kinase